MAIRLIAGRAGAGKTRHILDEVCRACVAEPFGPPIFILVPEQASYQTEKALLTHGALEGYTRAQVLSFTRLANFVFAHGPVPHRTRLSATHRALLVRLLVERARAAGEHDLYDAWGVEEALAAFIAEASSQALSVGDLQNTLARLETEAQSDPRHSTIRMARRKLAQMTTLLTRYDELVKERFEDPAETMLTLADRIAASDDFQGATVYIDGFTGFLPPEERILAALAKRCANFNLSLQIDPSLVPAAMNPAAAANHPVFALTQQTLQRIATQFNDLGLRFAAPILLPSGEAMPRFQAPGIAAVERGFLAGDGWRATSGDGVTLTVAESPADEARFAAEQVAKWLGDRAQNWSPADVVILARDLEPYADALEQAFTMLRIPFFIDRALPLETHPIVIGLQALLKAVENERSSGHLLALGKSGLLPISRPEVDFLEHHVRQYPRSAKEWRSPLRWQAPPPRRFDDEGDVTQGDLFDDGIDKTRRLLVEPVLALDALLPRGTTATIPYRQFVAALFSVADPIIVAQQWDEASRSILKKIGALLSEAIEAVGGEELSRELCVEFTISALAALTLPRIPPLLDQVFIGQADRSRQPPARGAIILGMGEGGFPRAIANTSLLTDQERELLSGLGLDLRPDAKTLFRREAHHAYRALTSASHQLIVLRPRADAVGKGLQPSAYWQELTGLLGIEAPPPTPTPYSIERSWTPRELAATLIRLAAEPALRFDAEPELVAKKEARLRAMLAQAQGLLQEESIRPVFEAATWRNTATLDRQRILDLYALQLRVSPSELESQAHCPFQHFVRFMLRPETPIEPRFEAQDAGNYAHAILQRFAELVREAEEIPPPGDQEIANMVAEARDDAWRRLEKTGLLNSAEGQIYFERVDALVKDTAVWLLDSWRELNIRPLREEARFNTRDADSLRPFDVDTDDWEWKVTVTGRIDRIDMVTAGGVTGSLIVDYKLSPRKMNYDRWQGGDSLQLPLYLLAMRQNSDTLGRPLGGLYVEIIPDLKDEKFTARKYRGLLPYSGAAAIVGAGGEGLGTSTFIDFPPKKSNPALTVPERGSVLPDLAFDKVLDWTGDMAHDLAIEIIEGTIAIHPSRYGDDTACSQCDLQSVCQMDYAHNAAKIKVPRPKGDFFARWNFAQEGIEGDDE